MPQRRLDVLRRAGPLRTLGSQGDMALLCRPCATASYLGTRRGLSKTRRGLPLGRGAPAGGENWIVPAAFFAAAIGDAGTVSRPACEPGATSTTPGQRPADLVPTAMQIRA